MATATVNFRRERLRRGWLDLYQHVEGGAWGVAWNPDFGEPDWPTASNLSNWGLFTPEIDRA